MYIRINNNRGDVVRRNSSHSFTVKALPEKGILTLAYKDVTLLECRPRLGYKGKFVEPPELRITEVTREGNIWRVELELEGKKLYLILEEVLDDALYIRLTQVPPGDEKHENIGILAMKIFEMSKALVVHLGRGVPFYAAAFGYHTEKAAGRKPYSSPPPEAPAYPVEKPEHMAHADELGQDPFSFPVVVKDLTAFRHHVPIIFMALKVKDLVVLLMPYSDQGYKSFIRIEQEEWPIRFWSRNFVPGVYEKTIPLGLVVIDRDPYGAVEKLGTSLKLVSGGIIRLREDKKFPEVFSYLGWCSWNAFLHDIDHKKIVDMVRKLIDKGAPIRFVIIDDGWHTLKDKEKVVFARRLASFLPDASKFPGGFRALVEELHKLGIRWVGVWHTLQGYWGGVDPEAFKEYEGCLIKGQDGRYMPSPIELKGFKFYHDWYVKLTSEGISFLKVDNQNDQPRFYAGQIPAMEGARNIHYCLQGAAYGTGLEILNCMCMTPENFFNWIVSNVSRASVDYIPKWKAGAKLHLMFCVYNSLWYSLFTWPDFDMFMSYDPYAWPHAIFRAISGGPVYITDGPLGEPNIELISKLALSDGKLPRPDTPAMPSRDIIFEDVYNDAIPLKAWSKAIIEGFGEVGIIALVNVNKDGVVERFNVKPSDVFSEDTEYLVYDWRDGSFRILKLNESIDGELKELDWKLFIVSPIKAGIGVVGLTKVFISPKGISRMRILDNGVILYLEDQGLFKLYIGDREVTVRSESGAYEVDERLSRPGTYYLKDGMLSILSKEGDKVVIIEFKR